MCIRDSFLLAGLRLVGGGGLVQVLRGFMGGAGSCCFVQIGDVVSHGITPTGNAVFRTQFIIILVRGRLGVVAQDGTPGVVWNEKKKENPKNTETFPARIFFFCG